MKFSTITTVAVSILTAAASPDFSLVGFGKENPIGTTTGGSGGETVKVSTPAELVTAVKGDKPRTIYASGTFNLTGRLKIGSNKSLLGTGSNTTITGAGINIHSVSNVVVRNLGIRFILGNDGITIQNSTHNSRVVKRNLKNYGRVSG
jgi:pectate lyase